MKPRLTTADFFLLRTPLLPLETTMGDSSISCQNKLGDHFVQEAIALAAPDLFKRWQAGGETDAALTRYLLRMTSRATPFGLMAGVSLGSILPTADSLVLESRSQYRAHARLDGAILHSLAKTIEKFPPVLHRCLVRTSTSLHTKLDRAYYLASSGTATEPRYEERSAKIDEPLAVIIAEARNWVGATGLIQALRSRWSAIETNEATAYLRSLIADGLIVTNVMPPISCSDGLSWLLRFVDNEDDEDSARMTSTITEMRGILSHGSPAMTPGIHDATRAIREALQPHGVQVGRDLVHIDLYKPLKEPAIPATTMARLLRDLEDLLPFLLVDDAHPLDQFAERFQKKYGERRVSLLEALDPETGISFDSGTRDPAPLVDGLRLDVTADHQPRPGRATPIGNLVLAGLTAQSLQGKEMHLRLPDKHDEKLKEENYPLRFWVMASLLSGGSSATPPRFLLRAIGGQSGIELFGRFGFVTEEMQETLRNYAQDEAADEPTAIFAEIAHLPGERLRNVVSRPSLRPHEIAYFETTATDASAINPSDVTIGNESGRLVLRTGHDWRVLIPRLTCAHNHSLSALPLYRFLCAFQSYHVPRLELDLGDVLNRIPYLPRIIYRNTVMFPARWRISRQEIAEILQLAQEDRSEVSRWFATRGLPRFLVFSEGDNALTFDRDELDHVRALADLWKHKDTVILWEAVETLETAYVKGPEGCFSNELVVPIISRTRDNDFRLRDAPNGPTPLKTVDCREQRFFPGSDWLFFKVYCSPSRSDELLRRIAKCISEYLQSGDCKQWFFIRFIDDAPHLRVRVKCAQDRFAGVFAEITQRITAIAEAGGCDRVQLDTYEAEVERYGGPLGMAASEDYFWQDSEAVITALDALTDINAGQEMRWRCAYASAHFVLSDLIDSPARRLLVAKSLRDSFAREYSVNGTQRRLIGQRYKLHRAQLLESVSPGGNEIAEIFARRGVKASSAIHSLRTALDPRVLDDVTSSLMHMAINRMLPSRSREHEVILYDYLVRELLRVGSNSADSEVTSVAARVFA